MKPSTTGFSLVEVMVSLSLGATLIAGLGHLFASIAQTHRHTRAVAEASDAARFAMAQLRTDVSMAGFFAGLPQPEHQLEATPAARAAYQGACTPQWLFDDLYPIDALDNARPEDVAHRFPCVTGSLDGADVLSIKRVAARCSPSPAHNRYYLHFGLLRRAIELGAPAGGAGCYPGAAMVTEAYQYLPAIWHLALDAGEPALCREGLSGRRMARSCVMRGIEDLQFEFGLDEPPAGQPADGIADRFVPSASAPAERLQIVAVRIHLLARSASPGGCPSSAYYPLGNSMRKHPVDGVCRRVASTTVALRNVRARRTGDAIPG